MDGTTNTGGGIQRGTDILAKSSNTDKMLFVFTDGYSNCGPNPNQMIDQAKKNGIKTVAIYTDYANKNDLSHCDVKYSVGGSYDSLYEAFAETVFKDIEQMIVPKYF